MMRLNILKLNTPARPRTHEGAPAAVISPEQALRRSVLSCMLWEGEFYEDGVQIAGRIRELVPQVPAEKVAALAVEARERMKLRHAPLLVVREMARHATHRGLVAETLARVVQRADELSEFVAIYWADGRQPLSAQVKKGLAGAFGKFDEYALAKYDRAAAVRLRDVLFLAHARPVDEAQAALWKRLAQNELATPDTWEVALSAAGRAEGVEKRAVWERLLAERKLGALALLRNLRNLHEAGVREEMVLAALAAMKTERVLPFRFLAAARVAPQWEEALETAMFRSIEGRGLDGRAARLAGHTVLLVDVSGSMESPLSNRSDMRRTDAAYGLAILLREIAEKVTIYTFSDEAKRVAARRGMALRDALDKSQPHSGTFLGAALKQVERECREGYDRMVVITDEQSHDTVHAPSGKGYVINVASNRNGVGYGEWTHIDGWSEAVVEYVAELESAG
ncbi:MAG TPA: TROVE domain-containing protein [Terracidiphilus sp.]|nr:TROVE domain-containing protein [Terracidiphilus sp.]